MPRAHVLLIALALTAPLVMPLARIFFGSFAHFAYDAGLRPVPERLDWHAVKPQIVAHLASLVTTALLDLLGFFVAYAAVLGGAYHSLLWVFSFFQS